MGFIHSSIILLAAFFARKNAFGMIYDDRCVGCIDVDVYFHVVTYDNGTIHFYDQTETIESIVPMIHENMRVVNYELNETPFVFNWKNPDDIPVVSNTVWTELMCEKRTEINFWSFLGDRKSINVYLGHYMRENRNVSGCAAFPFYDDSGTWMKFDILPPGGNGLTLVHEFGHWFGLHHTFTVFSNQNVLDDCDASNAGDYVDDTPVQLAFDLDTYTNQTSWDSCPDQPGEDAFWNIMNKVCRGRGCFGDKAYLTEGQIQRMYLVWLFYRQDDEDCGDDQFLFGAEFPAQRLGDEVIIFDEDGNEVYNLRTTWFNTGDLSMNLCLHRDTSYFVAAYDSFLIFVPDAVYSINGKVVKTVDRQAKRQAALFPMLSPGVSSAGNILKTYEAPESGCNSINHAILAFDELTGIEGASIYDMTGQGRRLERVPSFTEENVYPQCVPRNGNYALLACFYHSDSSNYTVLVDGNPRATVDGPFHNPFSAIPHCRLTLLTPALLLASDPVSTLSPTPAPPSIEVPVIFCFTGDSLVEVEHQGFVRMSALALGDAIKVAGNRFEAIYSFGHRNAQATGEFIAIQADGNRNIELSEDHMVAIEGGRFVPASMVNVGDKLVTASGEVAAIKTIRTVKRTGLYAPFTASGTVVVNGIVASNYVAFQGSEFLSINGVEVPLPFHRMAHIFNSVHRIAFKMGIATETYTDGGISKWVATPYDIGVWLLEQNTLVTIAGLVSYVAIFGFMSIIEWLTEHPLGLVGVVIGASTLLAIRRPKTETP